VRAEPLVKLQDPPEEAIELVRAFTGYTGSVNALVFTSFIRSDSLRCATFYSRRLSIPASVMTADDAYGSRDFGAGFACERDGWGAVSYWKDARVSYAGEWHFDIWDIFQFDEIAYVLVTVRQYSGECMHFWLHAFGTGASESAARIELWCY